MVLFPAEDRRCGRVALCPGAIVGPRLCQPIGERRLSVERVTVPLDGRQPERRDDGGMLVDERAPDDAPCEQVLAEGTCSVEEAAVPLEKRRAQDGEDVRLRAVLLLIPLARARVGPVVIDLREALPTFPAASLARTLNRVVAHGEPGEERAGVKASNPRTSPRQPSRPMRLPSRWP